MPGSHMDGRLAMLKAQKYNLKCPWISVAHLPVIGYCSLFNGELYEKSFADKSAYLFELYESARGNLRAWR